MANQIIELQNKGVLAYSRTSQEALWEAAPQSIPEYGPHVSRQAALNALAETFGGTQNIPRGYTFCVLEGETNNEKPVEYWFTKKGDVNSIVKKIPDVEAVNLEDLKFQVNPGTYELEYSIDGGQNWDGTGMTVPQSTVNLNDIKLRIDGEYNLQITYDGTSQNPTWRYIDGSIFHIDAPGVLPLSNIKLYYDEDTGFLKVSYDNGTSWYDGAYLAINRGGSSSFVNIPTYVVDKTNIQSFVYGGQSLDGPSAVNCIVLWGTQYPIQFYYWMHQNYATAPIGTKVYFLSSMIYRNLGYYKERMSGSGTAYTTDFPDTYPLLNEDTSLPNFIRELRSGYYASDTGTGYRYPNSPYPENCMSDYYDPTTEDYKYSIFFTTKISNENWTTLQFAGNLLPAYYYNLKASFVGDDIGNLVRESEPFIWDGTGTTSNYTDTYYANGISFGWEWEYDIPEDVEEGDTITPEKGAKTPTNWTSTVTLTVLENCAVEHVPNGFTVNENTTGGLVTVGKGYPFTVGVHTLTIQCTEESIHSYGVMIISTPNMEKYSWLILSNSNTLPPYQDKAPGEEDYIFNANIIEVRDQYTNTIIPNARVIKKQSGGEEYCLTAIGKTNEPNGPSMMCYSTYGDKFYCYAPGYNDYTSEIVTQQSYVTKITYYLEPKEAEYGTLTVTVQDSGGNSISGASALLDDVAITLGSPTRAYVGAHNLKVTALGYAAINETVYVSGQGDTKIATMQSIPSVMEYLVYKGNNKMNGTDPAGQTTYINNVYLGVSASGAFYTSTGSLEITAVAPKNNTDFTVNSITRIGLTGRPGDAADPHCVYEVSCNFKALSDSYAKTHDNQTPITITFIGIDGFEHTKDAYVEYQLLTVE